MLRVYFKKKTKCMFPFLGKVTLNIKAIKLKLKKFDYTYIVMKVDPSQGHPFSGH